MTKSHVIPLGHIVEFTHWPFEPGIYQFYHSCDTFGQLTHYCLRAFCNHCGIMFYFERSLSCALNWSPNIFNGSVPLGTCSLVPFSKLCCFWRVLRQSLVQIDVVWNIQSSEFCYNLTFFALNRIGEQQFLHQLTTLTVFISVGNACCYMAHL